MTVSFGTNIERLSAVQNAVNPHVEIGNWLQVLADPDAISALVRSGSTDLLSRGARQVENDLFKSPWATDYSGRLSTIHGGTGEAGRFSRPEIQEPGEGEQLSEHDALENLRRLQLGVDPGRTAQLRQTFLTTPQAQGATEALRRMRAGATYRNPYGLSHFRGFDTSTQRRLSGEAAGFGRSSQDFTRDILGNTPGGRQQTGVNSTFRRPGAGSQR